MRKTIFRLLIAELALREFYEVNQHYPRDLGELTPTYLDSVPLDPFSGQPFIYQLAGKKYRLYSVWGNREDDHGRMGRGDYFDVVHRDAVDADLDTSIGTYQQSMVAAAVAARGLAKTSGAKPAGGKSTVPAK